MKAVLIVVACCWSSMGYSETINNTLTGQPIVRCGPDSIAIQAVTESPFEGVVFIKQWRSVERCFTDYASSTTVSKLSKHPGLSVPMDELQRCGIEMRRNPTTKELEIFTVFVFSFHPELITMGDRAFAVHCTFRQREITVATRFDLVSEFRDLGIPVEALGATASMPSVVMKIVAGDTPDVSLPRVTTVDVGEPLTFIWHLPIAADIYGIRVKDCRAETLKGRRAQILDRGCSRDRTTIEDVQYTTDQMTAYARTMAFKFPDAEDLWFKCSVNVCVKKMAFISESNEHSCREIEVCTTRRAKRETADTSLQISTNLATADESLDTTPVEQWLRITDTFEPKNNGSKSRHTVTKAEGQVERRSRLSTSESSPVSFWERNWRICMGQQLFALVSSALLLIYLVTLVTVAILTALRCFSKSSMRISVAGSTTATPTYSDFFICRS